MLQKRVAEIAMINVDRIPKDRAGFGSILHVVEQNSANGEQMVFQLVMPEDADAEKGLISTTSPIGRALINKEPGDSVKVTTPGGVRHFEIVKLFTIHDEAAG
jgi:transcription elongation factor GreA